MGKPYSAPLRDRIVVKVANAVLRLATPQYRAATTHMLNVGFGAVVRQARAAHQAQDPTDDR